MSFPLRSEFQTGWHHVMNRGVNRQTIFLRRRDGQQFLDLLVVACERSSTEVHAYCLMDNHFHLLLACPDGGLSDTLHYLSSQYARWFNSVHGRDGHLFRGRFRSKVIDDQRYLATVGRYIHRNPLDRPGSNDLAALRNYRWSSYRYYVGIQRTPSWLYTEPLSTMFGDCHDYIAFVEGNARAPVERDWAVRVALLEADLDNPVGENLERVISVIVDHDLGLPADQQLDFPSVTARRMALMRARKRLHERPELIAVVDRAEELLSHAVA